MNTPQATQPAARRPFRPTWFLVAAGLAVVLGLAAWRMTWVAEATHPRETFQLALEAYDRKEMSKVAEILENLPDEPEYDAHRHLLQGMLLLASNKFEKALETLAFANQHPETRARAFALAGEIFYKAGNFRVAEEVLREAIKADSQQADAHRWLAVTYYDIGAMNDAITHLGIVAELDPADARPLRLSGLILKDFERYSDAVAAYEESLRRNPAQKDVLTELVHCLVKLREFERALEVFRDCDPTPTALTLAAECAYSLDNKEAARKYLAQALKSPPLPLETFQLQATIALDSNEVQRAEGILEQAVAQYPKDFGLRFKLAQAYRRLGKAEQADEQLKQSEELRELRRRFSDLHDQAIQAPMDAEVRYDLGVVARELEMMELSDSWFRASYALDSNYFQSRQAADAAAR
jgi:tetratricopeptide (TPR) repeat protein